MKELEDLLNRLEKVGRGLENGLNQLMRQAPLLVSQQMESLASQRLDSTEQHYMSAIMTRTENAGTIYIIEIDPEDWLANALETGVDGWDMHKTHLRGAKVRISRDGYRYKVIPISPAKGEAGTETGTHYKWLIQMALKNATYGEAKIKVNPDGSLQTRQQLMTDIPEARGLYRTQRWRSAEHLMTRKNALATTFVQFRVISEHPKNAHKWQHPGIQPVMIFPELQRWVDRELPNIASAIFDEEIKKAMEHV